MRDHRTLTCLAKKRVGHAGLTLIELVIVMGLLGILLSFLASLVSDSLRIWSMGEGRASLESRAHVALEAASADFEQMEGLVARSFQTGRKSRFRAIQSRQGAPANTGRFRSDFVPYTQEGKTLPPDVVEAKPSQLDWFPRLRFVLRLEEAEAEQRMRAELRKEILNEEGALGRSALAAKIRERLSGQPIPRIGECLLRVKPSGVEDGAYLELYRDVRVLDSRVKKRWVDDGEEPEMTTPLLGNLLYISYRFRSQYTTGMERQDSRAASKAPGAPELCWDSARAGTFPLDHPILRFTLDLDAKSGPDPLDDVLPRAIEVLVVVDEGPDLADTGILSETIDKSERQIRVDYPERLPTLYARNYVKIGSEWISYSGIDRDRLLGVRRGERQTAPRPHESGVKIHGGREAVLRLPIAVGRDSWNG